LLSNLLGFLPVILNTSQSSIDASHVQSLLSNLGTEMKDHKDNNDPSGVQNKVERMVATVVARLVLRIRFAAERAQWSLIDAKAKAFVARVAKSNAALSVVVAKLSYLSDTP